MDIIELPIGLIDEDTDQPRYQFDETSLQELIESIAELGLLSPIKVRTMPNGRYKIIYGNRRYKACKTLERPTIPCIVSKATDDLEIYLEQIAENLTREGFSPIEEAEAFHKLMNDPKFSSSTKFLSSKLGKPEAYIKNKCELLKFGNAVRKKIVSGTAIRKDVLTEEQLLPLKDLALEHRDSLALIVARDEMPVSDVKKLASLFKDPDISAGTKGKLLLKSGRDLLETWSVYRQNKAERAKELPPKAAKADKPAAAQAVQGQAAANGGAAQASVGAANAQADGAAARAAADVSRGGVPGQAAAGAGAPQASSVQQLLHALEQHRAAAADLDLAFAQLDAKEQAELVTEVDALLVSLEEQLQAWRVFRANTSHERLTLS